MGLTTQTEYNTMMAHYTSNPKIGRYNLSQLSMVSEKKCRNFLENQRKQESKGANSIDTKDNVKEGTVNRLNTPYSLEEIINIFDVDTDIWFVKRHVTNSWDVTSKTGTKTNYQTKVWWERSEQAETLDHIKDTIFDDLKKKAPKYTIKPYKQKGEHLLEINIRDLHLGKLCWEPETGENYDLKIAAQRVNQVLSETLEKAKVFGFNKIVIVGSDDFFNTDTIENTTTQGTQQDVDCRWQKQFTTGKKLWKSMIEMMREYAPVDVVMISGNHDKQRSFFLGEVLEAMFDNCADVYINNEPKLRKYYKYGNTLIGFTHGDGIKIQDLPLTMANEVKQKWADTNFREFHLGHFHKRKEMKWISTDEDKGCVVRHMRSLSATDAWHYQKGYIGTVRGCEAFLWSRKNGLNCMFETNLNLGGVK
jgi:hypothetical protein